MDLDCVEIRVLGCLIEKQRTTPDTYPLTLNALRLACNQSTNRDPVTDYGEDEVREAAQSLGRRRFARLASGHTTRTVKYRHLLDEALGLSKPELALLCVLMLRGPQTPGELKGRAERLQHFEDLTAVEDALGALIERGQVLRMERRPGQKEQRYAHLLGAEEVPAAEGASTPAEPYAGEPAPAAVARPATDDASQAPGFHERLGRLESEVGELRAELDALRRELGAG